jgi:Uma2 family endonuclease
MTQLLSNAEALTAKAIQSGAATHEELAKFYEEFETSGEDFEEEEDPEEFFDGEIDISHLVIEDDKPVDNFQSAQQQRLFVDAICSSKAVPKPFLAEANVGLFNYIKSQAIVPDMLLSLGVQRAEDWTSRNARSYMIWELGKAPDVCIEIVSNKEGDEVGLSQRSKQKGKTFTKKDRYALIGIPYYVVFDPLQQLQNAAEMNGALVRVWTLASGRYVELTPVKGLKNVGDMIWLETVGLGLTLWEGCFEDDLSRLWLRWCDRNGQVLPTGAEGMELERQRTNVETVRAEAEKERAEAEKLRADRLAEKLRALGIDPDDES